jgi:catalase
MKTPIFARFSTVTLGREFPDVARNPRGFAVKFYTGEGNYDIVGLNFVFSLSRLVSVVRLT